MKASEAWEKENRDRRDRALERLIAESAQSPSRALERAWALQSGIKKIAPGWWPMMSEGFEAAERELERARSERAGWAWLDVKSKYGTLRASGMMITPWEAARRQALRETLGDQALIHPTWLEEPSLSALNEKLRSLGAPPLATDPRGRWKLGMRDWAEPKAPEAPPEEAERLMSARAALDQIGEAMEIASALICERCGAPRGQLSAEGWMFQSCESCQESPGAMEAATEVEWSRPLLMLALIDARCMERIQDEIEAESLSAWEKALASLMPQARRAMAGADPNEDLGQGIRPLSWGWSPAMSAALMLLGANPQAMEQGGLSAQQRRQRMDPVQWAIAERLMLSGSAQAIQDQGRGRRAL